MLAIGQLIRMADEKPEANETQGLPNLAGLTHSIRRIEATALRNTVPLACVVIGPSRPGAGSDLQRQRSAAATLCTANLRLSDLFGWVDEADVGVVAYNTTAAGVISMVRRLNATLAEGAEGGELLRPLSAGVIELPANEEQGDRDSGPDILPTPRIASLARLAAAQAALREARRGGGGIRIGHTG
jgi:hypothetical protein